MRHDITTATKGTDWHAATDDLTQTGQIRRHAIVRLCAAESDTKTGHHLVNNQQCAILITQATQPRQEIRLWRDTVHVARYRLDDDTGDVIRIRAERFFDGAQIVIGAGQGVFGKIRRYTR